MDTNLDGLCIFGKLAVVAADMTEAELQRDILLIAPSFGCRLMRNNSGAFEDKRGQWIFFGLGNAGKGRNAGSSDLIGWTIVDGKAVFTAIECKRKGAKTTEQQQAFIDAVNAYHGIGAVCWSVDDFKSRIVAARDHDSNYK